MYLAEQLANIGHKVKLFEKESKYMSRASFIIKLVCTTGIIILAVCSLHFVQESHFLVLFLSLKIA
ncbi:TPA: hypothetical protein ACNVSN_000299 [Citrobacter freundii]